MFRVGINADGSAAEPVELTVTRALVSPDGMKRLDANRLDSPTTVDVLGNSAWVVEGQLGVLLGLESGPADLPFRVRRVWLY